MYIFSCVNIYMNINTCPKIYMHNYMFKYIYE